MPAQEAMHYGMINKVVPAEKLMETAREWADAIANGAPLTIQALKESLREIEAVKLKESFALIRSGTLPAYEVALNSEDSKEGVLAFAERRKANFKGK